MANVRKWINRLFVALVIPVLILGCCVVPVSASAGAGASASNSGASWQTFWHGYVDVFLIDPDDNELVVRMDLPQILAYSPGGTSEDPVTKLYIYGGEIPHSYLDASDVNYEYYVTYSSYDEFMVGNMGYQRFQLGYTFPDCIITKVVYHLSPITFYYFSTFFNSIYVVGDGRYSTRVDCDYIGAIERLPRHISNTYDRTVGYNTSANNNMNFASPLTSSQQNDFFGTPNLPYSTTLLKIGLTITWSPEQGNVDTCQLVVPVVSKGGTGHFVSHVSRVGGGGTFMYLDDDYWDATIDETITYWWQDEADLPDQADFFSWLVKPVSAFFDAQLFGSVTIGDIAYVIVGFSLVFWLLKFFAGG